MSKSQNNKIGEHIGRVKWFNNQRGFGFISYSINGEEKDIFVHHSGIKVQKENGFRTLKPGEYVSFDISQCEDNSESHKEKAVCVTGVNGGPLLVDVQRVIKENRKGSHNNQNMQVQ